MNLRPCTAADLRQVLEIEAVVYPRPWTFEQFLQELTTDYSALDLVFSAERLAGYICYWLVAGELHVLNVATAPECRRRGVGRMLLSRALRVARVQGAESACLEVRTSNVPAIELYRSFGFIDDCIRPKFYADGESALLMSCALDSVRSEV